MPACPRRRQRVTLHAAEADQIGAQRHRLDDVAAAIEAAVDDDGGAPGDRLGNFRQNIRRAAAVVELPAAVVGDVNEFHAVIERDLGVLRGGDALDRERNLELALDAVDRAPIERGLEFAPRRALPPGGDVALGNVALTPAVVSGIDREAEHRVLVRDRALDMIVDPGLVATDIELKHAQRIGRRPGDLFEAGIANRAQHVGDAEFARRP